MRRIVAMTVMVALFVATTGCAHSVIIDTDPTGGEVKVNGEKIGTSPVTYNETTGWEKIYEIEASKPGYKPTKKQVKQTEWNVPVVAGSVIGFFFCLIPIAGLLWSRQLPDRVVVTMDKGSGGSSGHSGGSDAPSYGY